MCTAQDVRPRIFCDIGMQQITRQKRGLGEVVKLAVAGDLVPRAGDDERVTHIARLVNDEPLRREPCPRLGNRKPDSIALVARIHLLNLVQMVHQIVEVDLVAMLLEDRQKHAR